MSKTETPAAKAPAAKVQVSILTANRLSDGTIVYLDYEGEWTEDFAEATVARTPDELLALEARGTHDAARNRIVDPYLVEVRDVDGRLVPIRFRERVRAAGPSVLGDVPGYIAPATREPRERGPRAAGAKLTEAA